MKFIVLSALAMVSLLSLNSLASSPQVGNSNGVCSVDYWDFEDQYHWEAKPYSGDNQYGVAPTAELAYQSCTQWLEAMPAKSNV